MFKSVYAKASLDEQLHEWLIDELYDLFAANLYDAEDEAALSEDDISFDIDDPSAPHFPLIIPFNQNFVDFDPARNPSQLTHPFYEQTFRPFLDGLDALINTNSSLDARASS